ncbi:sporulation transcriptional regulator SpoIIID [Paenisporosarcina cavernae]|uniref:Stage III sporulation protein D n=1 Tax=Paenisporosarcina cavernae TaxID=2320858 RepID=A0A385YTP1_9BACL|nr:sporulation transcriptional regulator SpoIIID [Paenisporosarcina cavernae]AYC28843.1 stage III sporulation protein D [Paenisporosarcina cavernae]
MQEELKKRVLHLAELILETKQTVRELAKRTGYSKSTVHKDLSERLTKIDSALAKEVKQILDYHKSIRHLRGGEATKLMWHEKKQKNVVT